MKNPVPGVTIDVINNRKWVVRMDAYEFEITFPEEYPFIEPTILQGGKRIEQPFWGPDSSIEQILL